MIVVGVGALLLAVALYFSPPVQRRLGWRVDFALTYLRGVIQPVSAPPTTLPQPRVHITRQAATPTASAPQLAPAAAPTLTPPPPTATPLPLPASVSLPAPPYERQDINNCGPASLSMYLNFFGWEGDQETVAAEIKPQRQDRNVNVEELMYFVGNYAGWLRAEYRVGGTTEVLKGLLAAGLPVLIEESFRFAEEYWPNDDQWAGHYYLLTGYDDQKGHFIGHDSFYGPDRPTDYALLDQQWQTFNRVYIVIFLPAQEAQVQAILGPDWARDANRQRALETAQRETESDPENAFTWFNLGSNLVYFERYAEAAAAFDTARNIGLPQRMLRYQFSPFIAYFHTGRTEDLLDLTEYAIERTPKSEEALLWHGWALYRQGKTQAAIGYFQRALAENSTYADAQYALRFAQNGGAP
jgi:tetratricopeptide (TPR) repeat protein